MLKIASVSYTHLGQVMPDGVDEAVEVLLAHIPSPEPRHGGATLDQVLKLIQKSINVHGDISSLAEQSRSKPLFPVSYTHLRLLTDAKSAVTFQSGPRHGGQIRQGNGSVALSRHARGRAHRWRQGVFRKEETLMSRYALIALVLAVVVASCLVVASCSKPAEDVPPIAVSPPKPAPPPSPAEEATESTDAATESADAVTESAAATESAEPADNAAPADDAEAAAPADAAAEEPATE